MARAICCVQWFAGQESPIWTASVVITNGDHNPGYSYIGNAPFQSGQESGLVWIDASPAALVAIQADDVNYIFVEEIVATEEAPAPVKALTKAQAKKALALTSDKGDRPDKTAKRKEKLTAAKKAKIRTWLRGRGHEAKKDQIIASSLEDTNVLIDLLCDLHGIGRVAQYEPATAG